jgi:hypothetical protein
MIPLEYVDFQGTVPTVSLGLKQASSDETVNCASLFHFCLWQFLIISVDINSIC